MTVSTSYPGIYVQELPSNSHAIQPAPTSIAAFVGYSHPFKTKQFNVAQPLSSFSDYETYFGPMFSSGLVDASLPRAVYQFFLNGGSTAYVVGLAPGLFDSAGGQVARFGDGGAIISASTSGGVSAPTTFTIARLLIPTIAAFSPVTVSGANVVITIKGSNFVPLSAVNWDVAGANPPTVDYVDASTLRATVPANKMPVPSVGATASVAFTVTNPGGGSATARFTITNLPPTINSLSPATVSNDVSADFPITIKGAGFVYNSTVQLGDPPNIALTTTYVDASTLTVTAPHGRLNATGPITVEVTNPGGGFLNLRVHRPGPER
jgi:hypothetical protein